MCIHPVFPQGLRAVGLMACLVASGPAFAAMPGPGCCNSGCPESTPPQRVGDPATDIQGIDASGASIRLSQFRGSVILLDVSSRVCGTCQRTAAPLQELFQAQGPRGLIVVACLAEDRDGAPVTQEGLEQWITDHQLTYPVMNDASGTRSGAAEQAYVSAAGGFPTLAVIDKDFKVRSLDRGPDLATVTDRIEGLLAQ
jgi:peroxiredoxin